MSHLPTRTLVGAAVAALLGVAAHAAAPQDARAAPAIQRLKAEISGADVRISSATGTARFVRVAPAVSLDLGAPAPQVSRQTEAALSATAASFLDRHGAAFGLSAGSRDLELAPHRDRRVRPDSPDLRPALQRAAGVRRRAQGSLRCQRPHHGHQWHGGSGHRRFHDAVGRHEHRPAKCRRLRQAQGRERPGHPPAHLPGRARQGRARARITLPTKSIVTNGRVRDFVYVDAHTGKVIDRSPARRTRSIAAPTTQLAPRRRVPATRESRSGSKARHSRRPLPKPTT